MRPVFRLTLVLLHIAFALTACTAVKLDPQAAVRLRTLTLVAPPEPRRYDINLFMPPGAGVRLGAYDAVLAKDIARPAAANDIDGRFTAALTKDAQLRLGAELAHAIEAALVATGYRITHSTDTAEAELVIAPLFAGYVDQAFRPYTPLLLIEIRLVDRADGATLFRQRYNYGHHAYLADDVRLAPDPGYTFADADALIADIPRAAEGLRAALPMIAGDLATKLTRQP